jgi:chloride channel protein, CIC family
MNFDSPSPAQTAQSHGSLLALAALALLVGAAAGAVGALFRLALEHADQWRNDLIVWAEQEGLAGFLLVLVTCTTAPLLAAWLVRHVSP